VSAVGILRLSSIQQPSMEVSSSQLLNSRTGADGNGGEGSVGLRVLGEEGWGGGEREENGVDWGGRVLGERERGQMGMGERL
jgi:hypothetical protein